MNKTNASSFRETMCHFSLRAQNNEYPRIFQVTGANQNVRKLLSTDLVNTEVYYFLSSSLREDVLWLVQKFYDYLFIPNCTRKNHVITDNNVLARRLTIFPVFLSNYCIKLLKNFI